ncbi:MAG: hypothetical protein GX846_00435 [Deltaproteobacteria bacterium]|nr:hypothetical protein [Deltaproteobacteria bacterium]
MRTKLIVVASALLFLLSGPAMAADVTGTWVAERTIPAGGAGRGGMGGGPQGPMKWTFNLKADGENLTGSVAGPMGRENQITEGKIEGDNISFVVKSQGMQGNEMKITYKGTISGDELTLTMEREGSMGGGPGGRAGSGMQRPPLVAKRQK